MSIQEVATGIGQLTLSNKRCTLQSVLHGILSIGVLAD